MSKKTELGRKHLREILEKNIFSDPDPKIRQALIKGWLIRGRTDITAIQVAVEKEAGKDLGSRQGFHAYVWTALQNELILQEGLRAELQALENLDFIRGSKLPPTGGAA